MTSDAGALLLGEVDRALIAVVPLYKNVRFCDSTLSCNPAPIAFLARFQWMLVVRNLTIWWLSGSRGTSSGGDVVDRQARYG